MGFEFCQFGKFQTTKSPKIYKSKFRASQGFEIADFETLDLPIDFT